MTARRGIRGLAWVLGGLLALIIVGIVGLVIWSQVGVLAAEPEPLAAVRADAGIRITDDAAGIVMEPAEAAPDDVGLVFIPGGKVDPWAYASKLSELVTDTGMTVVITKPWLNLAFFDLRPLSAFTDLAPEIDTWIVGGHSLGGVRSCQLAGDADALALFASYCANDEIPGASHSSFGDYGLQPGDGTPTIDDAAMREAITQAVDALAVEAAR